MKDTLTALKNSIWQTFAVLVFSTVTLLITFSTQASEVAIQIHQGAEEKALGHSLVYSNNFLTDESFRWGVAYSYMDQLKAEWNEQETFFDNNNVDIYTAYRFFPKSFSSFWRPFTFEVQAGASLSLTENKFIFEQYPDQEIVFSEKSDVNFMINLLTQYQLSRQTFIQLGFKSYPVFSEFGSQHSVFLGVNFQFGNNRGY